MSFAAAALVAALAAGTITAQPAATPCAAPSGPARIEGTVEQGSLLRGRAPQGTARVTVGTRHVPLAADGRFLLGLDRDSPPIERLSYHLACGRTDTTDLIIAPRAWRIERVNIARRPGGATAEFLARREVELARIVAARAVRSDAAGWAQPLIWPARGRISGRFGSQRIYRGGEAGSYHNGVDVAAGAGAPVVAPAAGTVVLAGGPAFSLEGNLVIVDHGHGLNSAFLHLSTVAVREGQLLRQGDPIGTVGATGRATGPHLHWALTWQGARLDPERATGAMR